MANPTVTISQAGRWLTVDTPLGTDAFILTAFEGEERISSLFHYRLELASAQTAIDADDILGKSVTFYVGQEIEAEGGPRCFNGVVKQFAAGPMLAYGYRSYYAEVVPALWFLTRNVDCRIFEKKSVKEIVEQVFRDLKLKDFDTGGIKGTPPKREYCVQYRESDFDFISRLLEEEGIFYFFKHEPAKHTLMLADQRSAYLDGIADDVSRRDLSDWRPSFAFRSGKWSQQDYNFETPTTSLLTSTQTLLKTPGVKQYEVFDYPGRYTDSGRGGALTKIRMEEEEASHAVAEGESMVRAFSPGVKFTLTDAEGNEDGGYVVTSVRHAASDPAHFAGGGGESRYGNSFTCIRDSVAYRPPRVTPKPLVHGPQTAIVVDGPDSQSYSDEYGRVRVRFHWVAGRQNPEMKSCWARVAQLWAGRKWGGHFVPRVNMEVIVEFLEGDPDQPIVVGCVYNGQQTPPYPANKLLSGIKTRSAPNGGEANFNELRFGDEKGKEEVYLHAEKDFNRVVENDDSLKVEHDQTITITNNRTETIEQGNDTVTIKMGNRSTKVSQGKSTLEAMQSIELKVGQSSVKIDQSGITLTGVNIKIDGKAMVDVKGPMTQVKGDGTLILKGGVTIIN